MQRHCRAFLAVVCFGLLTASTAIAQESTDQIEKRLREDLEYLADDAREGRGVGTKGLQDAGEFIAARFAKLGLDTKVFGDSPFQEFTVPHGFGLPKDGESAKKNWLKFEGAPEGELELGKQWTSLSLGSNGEFSGELVFVGYGITAKDFNYDDYADIDVKGKVVVVLRKEPTKEDGSSLFGSGTSRFAYFSTKLVNAVQHGAVGMIVVNDLKSAEQSKDQPFNPNDGGRAMNSSRVPTINLTRKALDPIVSKGTGKSLEQLEKQIGETKKPASQPIAGIKVSGSTEIGPVMATVRNVAAVLKGKGSLKDEYVIVGAHYDHVGMGGEGSLAPGTIAVHNGADDNGSGTISILEIARQLSGFKSDNHRTIIFMTFAAEERGLLGSEHYVRHPVVPLEQTVAMVNLDMVGRLGDGSVTVFGMGTGEEFSDWLDEANKPFGVELNKENAGMGPSDHQSFFLRNIPVFHFFTGLHGEYHRPSDDVNLIDFKGVAKIAQLTTRLTEKLATNKERPTFKKSQERARIGPNAGRKKPTLGVSLDGDAKQCVVTSVADPSPAKTAGVMSGDIILKLNGKSVASSEELVAALSGFKFGEEVEVQLKRGDQTMTLKAKL